MDIVSPVDQSVYTTVPLVSAEHADKAVAHAHAASKHWRNTPLDERKRILSKFVDNFVANKDAIATELAWLIGRPHKQNYNEISGFESRARHLIDIADSSLADTVLPETSGFKRYMRREPLGIVLAIAAWNYPYLISVNVVVAALLAGNAVILKQAPQTFVCGNRFVDAFKGTGIADGVFQVLHMDHDVAKRVIQDPRVQHVQFTGSVRGGSQVMQCAAETPERFVQVGLELGGNDPAYVRADVDNIQQAAEGIVDGAMYNSGQSCCGVQRIYVHASVHDAFVKACVSVAEQYKLGNPMDDGVTLGPVVRTEAADEMRERIRDALQKGATALIDESKFEKSQPGTPYIAPQILANVDHSMDVMTKETFGPIAGIMKVRDDDEAIALMNDSRFGLTASVWSTDVDAVTRIADALETGTVYMNRCDYLDPGLAWVGIKQSGRGSSLSKYCFDELTRPKSYNFRLPSK